MGHPRRRCDAHSHRRRPRDRRMERLPDLVEDQRRTRICWHLMRPVRGFWRWLTSMRTALILLLLLAIAAIPGSLLPQKGVDLNRVGRYVTDHPGTGPLFN